MQCQDARNARGSSRRSEAMITAPTSSMSGRGKVSNFAADRANGRGWWAMQGLNLRPSPCEGDALPLS